MAMRQFPESEFAMLQDPVFAELKRSVSIAWNPRLLALRRNGEKTASVLEAALRCCLESR